MHKTGNIIFTIIVFLVIGLMPIQGFFYDVGVGDPDPVVTTDLGQTAQDYIVQTDGLFVRLMRLFGVYRFTDGGTRSDTAIGYINYVTNILLGIAAFIATIFLIYAFYLIFFRKEEEGIENARKIIMGVVVALLIMGFAWTIISFLFYLYTLIR